MIKRGAVRCSLFALAMIADGSSAVAEGSAAKSATQASASPKPAARVSKVEAYVDPFADPPPAVKPGAPDASPAKASTTPVGPASSPKPAASLAAPPVLNVPSKEMLAFMKGLEGSWKCETTFAAGTLWPGSQPLKATTDIIIRREPGGFTWHGEFKLAKTMTTAATNGMFQIGYAGGIRQATVLSYDSVGTAMMGAGPLAGGSVTFLEEGFLKGAKVKARETLAAKGSRKIYHKVEIELGNGYQAMAEDTCAK